MNCALLLRTVRHLKATQVFHQLKYRMMKPTYMHINAPQGEKRRLLTGPISKFQCKEGNSFFFLNLKHEFAGWNFTENGMLWAYNQNYFDWINQDGISPEDGCRWIDRFIAEQPANRIGLDPYPIALRSINWVRFFCKYPQLATKERLDSLYSQIKLLDKKLEYHLLGNHLLEDAYALYIGGSFFNDMPLTKKAKKLLISQLEEQILPDGAHYEQSPMYHCILLDRLLDCINIEREDGRKLKEKYAVRMLGHLESITYRDGSIPLLNDSANGIAPTPSQIFDYAKRLGLEWKAIPMDECGYRKMYSDPYEAIVDVGNITATYQPGHTHADTFNYELRIENKPFVVDCGISTYNKTERRQYERATTGHNCVTVNGLNSSEVWGGFRVGKRCQAKIIKDTENVIEACHNGFGKTCKRRFEMTKDGFVVEDWYEGEAVSYIHLAEKADVKRVIVVGDTKVEVRPWKYSTEYNKFKEGKEIQISFNCYLKYMIQ